MPSGFVDRFKGKVYENSASLAQFGSAGATVLSGGQLNSTASAAPAGGTALSTAQVETALASYTLPGNSMERPGRNVIVTAWGVFSTATANPRTAKLYFGAQSVLLQPSTAAAPTQAGGQPWWLQLDVFATSTAKSGGTQTVIAQNILSTVHGGCSISTGAENLALASTIKVTGMSTQSTAVGDVTLFGFQVQGFN